MSQTKLNPVRLLRFADLKAIGINYSREHLWRLERENKFPRRIRLSPQKIAWIEAEVTNWLREKSEARTSQEYAIHD